MRGELKDLGEFGTQVALTPRKENWEAFEFSIPNNLVARLVAVAFSENCRPSVIILTIFLELLRRYTGQESVAVRFQDVDALPQIVGLSGNYSVKDAIQIAHRAHPPAAEIQEFTSADGQLSFVEECCLADVIDSQGFDSPVHCSICHTQKSLSGSLNLIKEFSPDI